MIKFPFPKKNINFVAQSTPHGWIASLVGQSFLFPFHGEPSDFQTEYFLTSERVICFCDRSNRTKARYYTKEGTAKEWKREYEDTGIPDDAWVVPELDDKIHNVFSICTIGGRTKHEQALAYALGVKQQAIVIFNPEGKVMAIDPVPEETLFGSFMSHDNATIFFTTNKSAVIIDNPLV